MLNSARLSNQTFVLLTLIVAACSTDDPGRQQPELAYRPADDCLPHGLDECQTAGCEWAPVAADCGPDQAGCGPGICTTPDPCSDHTDVSACEQDVDNRCAWMATDSLCPVGADCNDGFCYQTRDDGECTCVCPLACPAGEDCPPCACDCPTNGGEECPWICPDCDPSSGAPCPPCYQDCGEVCPWICPDCSPDSEFCAPCYQDCSLPPECPAGPDGGCTGAA